jgi:hypothetical protein
MGKYLKVNDWIGCEYGGVVRILFLKKKRFFEQ